MQTFGGSFETACWFGYPIPVDGVASKGSTCPDHVLDAASSTTSPPRMCLDCPRFLSLIKAWRVELWWILRQPVWLVVRLSCVVCQSARGNLEGSRVVSWIRLHWARNQAAIGIWRKIPFKTLFFGLDAAWVRSRAERPSVSYTKVTAKSQGQAISCKYTTKPFKQLSGSNKYLIAGDGEMERMRQP